MPINTKEEIITQVSEAFCKDYNAFVEECGEIGEIDVDDIIEEHLGPALDRYALALVEQSLPEEKTGSDIGRYGFNACRSQVLENALKLLSHE